MKTRSNRALVKFLSDHSNEKKGFKLSWRAYKKEPSNTLPPRDETTGRGKLEKIQNIYLMAEWKSSSHNSNTESGLQAIILHRLQNVYYLDSLEGVRLIEGISKIIFDCIKNNEIS